MKAWEDVPAEEKRSLLDRAERAHAARESILALAREIARDEPIQYHDDPELCADPGTCAMCGAKMSFTRREHFNDCLWQKLKTAVEELDALDP